MKTIKINFVDFPIFNYKKWFLYRFLSQHYELEISDKPDYLFCSCFGYSHWKYQNCIKIFYTGENITPDFNIYDYAIDFHYLTLNDRHLRLPLWLSRSWYCLDYLENKQIDESLCQRKFCNFVFSNTGWADPIRETFYRELSKYKRIDSGGAFLNNIGYRVPDKLEFIKDYKFTIAIENSAVSGYTTEKLTDSMQVNSLPIYYGNPLVEKDFNSESFVHLRDFENMQDCIDYIIALDKDDSLYLDKLSKNWFATQHIKEQYDAAILEFFKNIFEQDKVDASRITDYGFAKRYRKEMSRTTPWANTFIVEKGYGLIDRFKRLRTSKKKD